MQNIQSKFILNQQQKISNFFEKELFNEDKPIDSQNWFLYYYNDALHKIFKNPLNQHELTLKKQNKLYTKDNFLKNCLQIINHSHPTEKKIDLSKITEENTYNSPDQLEIIYLASQKCQVNKKEEQKFFEEIERKINHQSPLVPFITTYLIRKQQYRKLLQFCIRICQEKKYEQGIALQYYLKSVMALYLWIKSEKKSLDSYSLDFFNLSCIQLEKLEFLISSQPESVVKKVKYLIFISKKQKFSICGQTKGYSDLVQSQKIVNNSYKINEMIQIAFQSDKLNFIIEIVQENLQTYIEKAAQNDQIAFKKVISIIDHLIDRYCDKLIQNIQKNKKDFSLEDFPSLEQICLTESTEQYEEKSQLTDLISHIQEKLQTLKDQQEKELLENKTRSYSNSSRQAQRKLSQTQKSQTLTQQQLQQQQQNKPKFSIINLQEQKIQSLGQFFYQSYKMVEIQRSYCLELFPETCHDIQMAMQIQLLEFKIVLFNTVFKRQNKIDQTPSEAPTITQEIKFWEKEEQYFTQKQKAIKILNCYLQNMIKNALSIKELSKIQKKFQFQSWVDNFTLKKLFLRVHYFFTLQDMQSNKKLTNLISLDLETLKKEGKTMHLLTNIMKCPNFMSQYQENEDQKQAILKDILTLFDQINSRFEQYSVIFTEIKPIYEKIYNNLFEIFETFILKKGNDMTDIYTLLYFYLLEKLQSFRLKNPQLLFRVLNIYNKANASKQIGSVLNKVLNHFQGGATYQYMQQGSEILLSLHRINLGGQDTREFTEKMVQKSQNFQHQFSIWKSQYFDLEKIDLIHDVFPYFFPVQNCDSLQQVNPYQISLLFLDKFHLFYGETDFSSQEFIKNAKKFCEFYDMNKIEILNMVKNQKLNYFDKNNENFTGKNKYIYIDQLSYALEKSYDTNEYIFGVTIAEYINIQSEIISILYQTEKNEQIEQQEEIQNLINFLQKISFSKKEEKTTTYYKIFWNNIALILELISRGQHLSDKQVLEYELQHLSESKLQNQYTWMHIERILKILNIQLDQIVDLTIENSNQNNYNNNNSVGKEDPELLVFLKGLEEMDLKNLKESKISLEFKIKYKDQEPQTLLQNQDSQLLTPDIQERLNAIVNVYMPLIHYLFQTLSQSAQKSIDLYNVIYQEIQEKEEDNQAKIGFQSYNTWKSQQILYIQHVIQLLHKLIDNFERVSDNLRSSLIKFSRVINNNMEFKLAAYQLDSFLKVMEFQYKEDLIRQIIKKIQLSYSERIQVVQQQISPYLEKLEGIKKNIESIVIE